MEVRLQKLKLEELKDYIRIYKKANPNIQIFVTGKKPELIQRLLNLPAEDLERLTSNIKD